MNNIYGPGGLQVWPILRAEALRVATALACAVDRLEGTMCLVTSKSFEPKKVRQPPELFPHTGVIEAPVDFMVRFHVQIS